MLLFFTSSLTHVFKVQIGVPPIRDSPPPSKVCTHQKAMIKTPQIYAWISCSFCRSLPLVSQQLQQYSFHISPPFSNLKSSQKKNDHHCATFLPYYLQYFSLKHMQQMCTHVIQCLQTSTSLSSLPSGVSACHSISRNRRVVQASVSYWLGTGYDIGAAYQHLRIQHPSCVIRKLIRKV